MEMLKSWVISICTTVFFITAIEMLLPDNSFKKYAKFVLGLILMAVIINPLVKLINKGTDISTFINQSSKFVQQQSVETDSNYKEASINDTLSVFKSNLEELCSKKLKEKYSRENCKVEADVKYDYESQEYIIEGIKIGINSRTVEKVKKIEINTSSSVKNDDYGDSKLGKEIKAYISDELEIAEGKISVYKLTQ